MKDLTIVEICDARLREGRHIADSDVRELLNVIAEQKAEISRLTPKPKPVRLKCDHVNVTDVWEDQERPYWVCDDCGLSNL